MHILRHVALNKQLTSYIPEFIRLMQDQFDITQVCFNASLISTKNSRIMCFISAKNRKI